MRTNKGWVLAFAGPVCLGLAACGGEDAALPAPVATSTGSGGGGSSQTDPPATANLPPAPFGLLASAGFGLVGWQSVSADGAQPAFAQAPDKATLEWSATDKTYRIALADLGSGRLVYTFPPSGNNRVAFSIIQADGSVARAYVTLVVRPGSVGDLYWQSADGVKPFVYGRAIFGLPVPAGALPATGGRVFVAGLQPEAALRIDFTNRTVRGAVAAFYDGGPFDAEGPVEVGTIEPAVLQPDGTFIARLTVPGAPRPGELRGRLYDPAADQVGLYWNAPVRDSRGEWIEWQTVTAIDACQGCPAP